MTSCDNIKIRVIQPQERNEILDFLRIHYYKEEPLTCGSEPKHQDKLDEEFDLSGIEHGTCLVADLQDNIVGVVLAGPKGPNEADHLFQAAAEVGSTKWGKILHFLAIVERDAAVCQHYEVKRVLHAHAMGVDSQHRGKNIAGRLLKDLMKVARGLKYEVLTADCTSYYSAKLCERLGWDLLNVAYYKDFLDERQQQIFQPPMPHDCCRTFAIRL